MTDVSFNESMNESMELEGGSIELDDGADLELSEGGVEVKAPPAAAAAAGGKIDRRCHHSSLFTRGFALATAAVLSGLRLR